MRCSAGNAVHPDPLFVVRPVGDLGGMQRLQRQPRRTTVLYDGGKELGRLVYPKWYSSRAEILLPEGIYDVGAKSFWSTGLAARLQDVPIVHVRFPWKGGATLERPGRPERDLVLKRNSFWTMRHTLTDALGQERLRILSKPSWRHMDHNHEIEWMGGPPPDPLEVLLAVHAINVKNRRAAASAG